MKRLAQQHLHAIFEAGIAVVQPGEAIQRHVTRKGVELRVGDCVYNLSKVQNIFVVGAGKAVAHMALALESILGERITAGRINVKPGHGLQLQTIRVREAGHPIPDQAGVDGTREIAQLLDRAKGDDLVICLLTGGGSALMPLPVSGVSLSEKQAITHELLACGANIREINMVRKHLSQVKGGRLARLAQPAQVLTVILSDVIGDSLDTIGSGPTAPDGSTFAEALDVLTRYGIENQAPASALEHLRAGAAGKFPDTPDADDPIFAKVNNVIVANNSAAVHACAQRAEELGYRALIHSTMLAGEAHEVAQDYVKLARKSLDSGQPVTPPACIISGGETTVTLRGNGLGGRNQEFALAAAIAASGMDRIALLAAGTDGTDGPTDAAGAFADGETCRRAEELRLNAGDALARNDSYHFFEALGDLLKTGPTGTNVMDLYLLLLLGCGAETTAQQRGGKS